MTEDMYKTAMLERLLELDNLLTSLKQEYDKLVRERAARARTLVSLPDLVPFNTVKRQVMDFVHTQFGWDEESMSIPFPTVRSLADPTGTIVPIGNATSGGPRRVEDGDGADLASGDEVDPMGIDNGHEAVRRTRLREKDEHDEDDRGDGRDDGRPTAGAGRGRVGASRPKRPRLD